MSFLPAYYKSGAGLSASDEMPLGTGIVRFGRSLSFLQAIYLGMCFTGGLGCWVQTPGLCSVLRCTSLGLNQVSHIMDCWEPIIWEVLPFLSLCFFSGLLGKDSEKPAEPIMRGGQFTRVQISAWAHTRGLRRSWEQVGLSWHPFHENLPQKSVYLKELTKVLDIFYPLAEGKVVHTSE